MFPLAPASKEPLAGSHGFKDATRDVEQIRRWWTETPDANIGVATGSASGFFVVDIDPRNGGDETLRDLEAEHGPLPPTVTVKTPGGGAHYYFQMPEEAADAL